jgi:hypothetical protein
VERDLADKVEKVLRADLTEVQKLIYESILTGAVPSHNKMIQLRKVCNSPLLFHPYVRGLSGSFPYDASEDVVKVCGKFSLLDNILPKLKATGHRVLIFNQMTKTMNILEDYFRLRNYSFLRLDGNTEAAQRTEYLKLYQEKESEYFIFILSTRAGGLGLNLQSADTVILFDSDWNPQNDMQAMARSHRIGQKQQVLVLRLITSGTVEEKVLATAHTKLTNEQMVIQAGMFHDHYSDKLSREMVEKVIREESIEGDEPDENGAGGGADEVSKALARSEEELKIFQQMDEAERKRIEKSGEDHRQFPDSIIPKWVYDYCLNGSKSLESSNTLIPYSRKKLFHDRYKSIDPRQYPEQYQQAEEAWRLEPDDSELLTPQGRAKAAKAKLQKQQELEKQLQKLREEKKLSKLKGEEAEGDSEDSDDEENKENQGSYGEEEEGESRLAETKATKGRKKGRGGGRGQAAAAAARARAAQRAAEQERADQLAAAQQENNNNNTNTNSNITSIDNSNAMDGSSSAVASIADVSAAKRKRDDSSPQSLNKKPKNLVIKFKKSADSAGLHTVHQAEEIEMKDEQAADSNKDAPANKASTTNAIISRSGPSPLKRIPKKAVAANPNPNNIIVLKKPSAKEFPH